MALGGSNWGAHAESRCLTPQSDPLIWQNYLNPSHQDIVDFAAWLDSLPITVQQIVAGSIDALTERAARGEIVPPSTEGLDDLKPVHIDPHMFELRWEIRRKLIRQYHAEPDTHPRHLVSLHLHLKADRDNPEDDTVVKARQDAAISQAALRYRAGEVSSWGIG